MTEIYLGIGGNLGNRLENIEKTITLVSQKIATPSKVSSIYMSEPWGFEHVKYFTNAVLLIQTDLSPEEVLKRTCEIESEMKRVRSTSGKYQGRTMDIDILFYGEQIINTTDLIIPHPRLEDRFFVLLPIKEISADFIHPKSKIHINELIESCTDSGKIRKLNYGA